MRTKEMTGIKVRNIGTGIWIYERPFRLFGAEFGNRMTAINLNDGEFPVHSPSALDHTTKGLVETLGHTVYLITTNAFRGQFINEGMAAPFFGIAHASGSHHCARRSGASDRRDRKC